MANQLYYSKKIWKIYSKNAIKLPSLALAYLAATMRNKGHEVMIIDANAMGWSNCDVIKKIWDEQPDYLCFSLITDTFQNSLESIRKIKSMCNKPVIVGGPHMSVYPKETMEYEELDYGVIGDGFETLPELIDKLDNDDFKGLRKVEGLVYYDRTNLVMTNPRNKRVNLDDVPFPARDLLPNDKYDIVLSKRKNVTVFLTALGCPYYCKYCCTDTKIVYRSPESIVDEIEECKKIGINEIDIYDETFTVNKDRVHKILDLIEERNIDILFSIRTRCDCVDKRLLERLADNGCVRVNFGIESASERVLRSIGRNMSKKTISDAIQWAKDAGIQVLGFFMIGLPGETEEEIKETLRFMRKLPLDFIQLNKFTYIPNSEIYRSVMKKYGRDYWKEYVEGKITLDEFPSFERTITEEKLNEYLEEGYHKFYFRVSYIWNKFISIKSFGEFWRLAKGALDLK